VTVGSSVIVLSEKEQLVLSGLLAIRVQEFGVVSLLFQELQKVY
jgi:hypothetical protein